MMSNYLDPIARVWGSDFQPVSFAKAGCVVNDKSKKSKRKLKKKNNS